MATGTVGSVLIARYAALKEKRENIMDGVRMYEAPRPMIIIKPASPTWEALEEKLRQVVNYEGVMRTARELYDQGYGAELETAIEIALAKYTKSRPYNYFARMISKKSGNWATRTVKVVYDTWEVRRNALLVLERLKLPFTSTKAILALSWRLRGTIIRYLGMATEQGTGIRNPAGIFFALIRKPTLA